MRKLLTITLALAMALSLTACGDKANGNGAPLYEVSYVQAMVDAGAFSEDLEELDAETAFLLYKLGDYGLTQEDVKDCAVLRSAGATCEEGAVLVFTDAAKAEAAEGALKDYIQGQISANEDYRPAEIPKLENALIQRHGESLLLAVADDLDAAKQPFA